MFALACVDQEVEASDLSSLCYGFESHPRHEHPKPFHPKILVTKGLCHARANSHRSCVSDGACKGINVASRYRRFVSEVLMNPVPPAVFNSNVDSCPANWPASSRSAKTSRGLGG